MRSTVIFYYGFFALHAAVLIIRVSWHAAPRYQHERLIDRIRPFAIACKGNNS
jgi:hypothetical protein